jgi:hypothetical protein
MRRGVGVGVGHDQYHNDAGGPPLGAVIAG